MRKFSYLDPGATKLLNFPKLFFVIFIFCLFIASFSLAEPYYRVSGLINIPDGYVLPQGIFNAGVHTTIQDQKRDEFGFKIYFGMLNLAEFGLMEIQREDENYILGNAKILFIRESDLSPGVSIGVDNVGEKVQDESESYQRSFYGVISKKFNLPFIHFVSGHLGVGNHRYSTKTSPGKYLHGVFLGLDKKIQISFLNSHLHFMGELDGVSLNFGLQYLMDTGLSIALAAGNLTSDVDNMKFHFSVNFTNENIMKRVDQSIELAKRAVKIANESRE